ncbi:MAG: VPLPA-CTERM-specific exosortase XrtD [Pseudomonadota bacterium]
MSVTNEGRASLLSDSTGLMRGGALVAILCISAVLFFQGGIVDLWTNWQTPEYSHGPLIPVISFYLFLRQLKTVPANPGPVTDRWPGVMVLALALLLGLAGNIAQIEKITALALIIWTGGVVLTSFGWARGRQFWPPVVHLAFMMPLPFFLYWKTSIFLQGISAGVGVSLIQAVGIPVYLDGNIIDLGEFKLHVAEACSGLRYLFPIMSFTYLFAVLYQGSIWHKVILLMAAVPIAVIMNSIRVGVVGIMVDARGIEAAEGFMHFFEGWVIFILCILTMIAMARIMQRLSGDRRSLAEVLDLDTTGLGAQIARVRDIQPSAALIGAAAAFSVAAMLWNPLTRPEQPAIERDPFLLFPRDLGQWHGIMRPELETEVANILGADDYLSISYAAPGRAADVDLFIAWYSDQTKAEIHTPEVCIPAGGWEMSDIEVKELAIETAHQTQVFPVNRAIIQKGLSRQLVYYWFDQSGRRIADDYAAKAYLIWDGLKTGRTDGALVRFVTPIVPGEAEAAADARLQDMMRETLPVLPGFISTVEPEAG